MILVTSIAAGRIGDILGRRRTLLIGACVFVTGGFLQTIATSYYTLVFGRFVSGAGVGLLSYVHHSFPTRTEATLFQHHRSYISERNLSPDTCGWPVSLSITPANDFFPKRGKLACIEFTGNICGYAFSVVRNLTLAFLTMSMTSMQWVDYFASFLRSNHSWRLPLLLQCIIGCVLALGTFFIPESPR